MSSFFLTVGLWLSIIIGGYCEYQQWVELTSCQTTHHVAECKLVAVPATDAGDGR